MKYIFMVEKIQTAGRTAVATTVMLALLIAMVLPFSVTAAGSLPSVVIGKYVNNCYSLCAPRPDIDGDLVVWKDFVSPSVQNLFVYSITTGETVKVTSDKNVIGARISGKRVVWTEYIPNQAPKIFAYDSQTKQIKEITTAPNTVIGDRNTISIDGTSLVTREPQKDVMLYDVQNNTSRALNVDNPGIGVANPEISGNTVMYGSSPSKYGSPIRLYAKNISDGSESFVTTWNPTNGGVAGNAFIGIPRLLGDKIAFADFRNSSKLIHVYIATISGNVKQISNSKFRQLEPDISGSWVVYREFANGRDDLKAYNIKTGATKVITADANPQLHPAIFTTASTVRIVWSSTLDNSIHLTEFPNK